MFVLKREQELREILIIFGNKEHLYEAAFECLAEEFAEDLQRCVEYTGMQADASGNGSTRCFCGFEDLRSTTRRSAAFISAIIIRSVSRANPLPDTISGFPKL